LVESPTLHGLADNILWLDSTWDVVHTFIRLAVGAAPAAAALGDAGPVAEGVAALGIVWHRTTRETVITFRPSASRARFA
jgi:hypothetical protein